MIAHRYTTKQLRNIKHSSTSPLPCISQRVVEKVEVIGRKDMPGVSREQAAEAAQSVRPGRLAAGEEIGKWAKEEEVKEVNCLSNWN